jgi:aspartyl-tRNA synthetase
MSSLIRRTHTCGVLREKDAGQQVVLQGWAHSVRDAGGVIFLVLRDHTGTTQITLDERSDESVFEEGRKVRLEYVVQVHGEVVERHSKNPQMETGSIEVLPSSLVILNRTKPLPFAIGGAAIEASEEVRLTHRYLDLRRPSLQQKLFTRHKAALMVRKHLDESGFIEVETPILNRSTPEGARDYLVPSRVHPGYWYALPQSPQIFKQLLMVSGFDRYFQIVKCFRDEDLRADRQPEFTQIDMELSFATTDLVMEICNALVTDVWKQVVDYDVGEIPVLSYAEAIQRFGVDNPDTRFEMELFDLDWGSSEFRVVSGAIDAGGICRGMVVKGASADTSRKVINAWTEFVRRYRLGGLLWGKINGVPESQESWSGPLSKVEADLRSLAPDLEEGDILLVAAGPAAHVNTGLGRLRAQIGRERDLTKNTRYAFCWVTEFPAFEHDEEEDRWVAVHHPFTKPLDEHIEYLGTGREGEVLSDAYDLVCNGYEIGGGSIRIHDSELQRRVFDALGLSMEEANEKFGFLMNALSYGAPPHGGLAMGFDRWIMLLCNTENIRDVIAFPKTTKAQDLMAAAPNRVDPVQLAELHVANTTQED